MTSDFSRISALSLTMQGHEMLQPEEVAAMVRLHRLGWRPGGGDDEHYVYAVALF